MPGAPATRSDSGDRSARCEVLAKAQFLRHMPALAKNVDMFCEEDRNALQRIGGTAPPDGVGVFREDEEFGDWVLKVDFCVG